MVPNDQFPCLKRVVKFQLEFSASLAVEMVCMALHHNLHHWHLEIVFLTICLPLGTQYSARNWVNVAATFW